MQDGEQAAETVRPVGWLTMMAQQEVQQQRRPELPANGVFAVPEEVRDAQGLFDLIEEYFNAPAAFGERSHSAGGPCGVVRNEDRGGLLAVEFDEHFHPPEGVGVLVSAFGGLFEEPLFDGVGHVVLLPCEPVDAAPVEGGEVEEIDVGLVK